MEKVSWFDLAHWTKGQLWVFHPEYQKWKPQENSDEDGKMAAKLSRRMTAIIDSRSIQGGEVFIALAGTRADGHDFVEQALAAGALGAVVSRSPIDCLDYALSFDEVKFLLQVENTESALADLARGYKQKLGVDVVAVTGSTGKTSTKDIIASALGEDLNVAKTQGNFNNEIGLPLTILGLQAENQAAVLEMGMRGLGQIHKLCSIAEPELGVITNIGPVHMELLGSMEAIAQAKGELLMYVKQAVLNGEDPWVVEQARSYQGEITFFALSPKGMKKVLEEKNFSPQRAVKTVLCQKIIALGEAGSEVVYQFGNFSLERGFQPLETCSFQLALPGEHQVKNALAAIGVGKYLGLESGRLGAGLAKAKLSALRWETFTNPRGVYVINDTYNANPEAMDAALKTVAQLAGSRRKIAILGDMFELGDAAISSHQAIGQLAVKLNFDYLVAIGKLAEHYAKGALVSGMDADKIIYLENRIEAIKEIEKLLQNGDCILLKGSRGMKLEELVDALR